MKNNILMLLYLSCLVFLFAGCSQKEIYQDTLQYEGKYYTRTDGYAIEMEGQMIGEIVSSVEKGALPKKNMQCNNEQYVGCEMYMYAGEIYVKQKLLVMEEDVYMYWEQGEKPDEGPIANEAPDMVWYNKRYYGSDKWVSSVPHEEGYKKVTSILFFDSSGNFGRFPAGTSDEMMLDAEVYASENDWKTIYVGPIESREEKKYLKMSYRKN